MHHEYISLKLKIMNTNNCYMIINFNHSKFKLNDEKTIISTKGDTGITGNYDS